MAKKKNTKTIQIEKNKKKNTNDRLGKNKTIKIKNPPLKNSLKDTYSITAVSHKNTYTLLKKEGKVKPKKRYSTATSQILEIFSTKGRKISAFSSKEQRLNKLKTKSYT